LDHHIEWVTAENAIERLCIRKHTFYSYVSRGRICSKVDPDNPRKSLYSKLDIERMAQQPRAARRRALRHELTNNGGAQTAPYAVSAVPADWSADPGPQPLALLQRPGLEEPASRLWGARPDVFAGPVKTGQVAFEDGSANILDFLGRRSKTDPSPFQRPQTDLHKEGATLIKGLAQAVACVPALPDEPIHMQLARGWRAPDAAEPLRRALFLLVDKTLNAPSLAARIAAASGASLAGCVLSGLTKLKATQSGREARVVARLVQRAARSDLISDVGAWPGGVRSAPGFSDATLTGFDTRVIELLTSFELTLAYQNYGDLVKRSGALIPNIQFALAALVARFDLPQDAAFLILGLARSPGWIAHALEEAGDRPAGLVSGDLVGGDLGQAGELARSITA
jgi:citrate synthase